MVTCRIRRNDFLKPESCNGKNVTPYPADDDATLWVFTKVVEKYGWDYMDKYMAAKPNFIQGHLGQQRSVATGQNSSTIDSIFNITSRCQETGQPGQSRISRPWTRLQSGRCTGAMFKGAPHPNAGHAVLDLVAGAGAADRHRHLVPEGRPAPAVRLSADLLLQGRKRLSGLLTNEPRCTTTQTLRSLTGRS